MNRFDHVIDVARRQIAEGQHRCAQLYVSVHGQVVLDIGIGTDDHGEPVGPQHLLPWFGCTRMMTTAAIVQLWERGRLALDDPVSRWVPGWAGSKQAVTVRHVLTHLGGFATVDTTEVDLDHAECLSLIANHPAEHPPGRRAAYHRSAAWRVLAEIVRTCGGRTLGEYLQTEIWEPAAMVDTHLGLAAQTRGLGPRLVLAEHTGVTRDGWRGHLGLTPTRPEVHRADWFVDRSDPDAGGRGPAGDLGRLLEALWGHRSCLLERAASSEASSTIHRAGVRDGAFGGARVPWGLGMMVAGGFAGAVGHRAVGHDGLPGGRALWDPDEGMAMVFLTNGLIGPVADARRLAQITEAVYEAVAPTPTGAVVRAEPSDVAMRG